MASSYSSMPSLAIRTAMISEVAASNQSRPVPANNSDPSKSKHDNHMQDSVQNASAFNAGLFRPMAQAVFARYSQPMTASETRAISMPGRLSAGPRPLRYSS